MLHPQITKSIFADKDWDTWLAGSLQLLPSLSAQPDRIGNEVKDA